MKKDLILFLIVILAAAMACTLPSQGSTEVPPTATLPSVELPTDTPTVEAPAFEGIPFSFSWLSLVIPPGLASGANGEEIDRADGEDVAPWGLTPGNIELTLEGYLLQDKFHQPRVYVYPAQAFSDLVPAVGDNIQRIENILGGALAGAADLPHITFFGAAQVFASNIQTVTFQNGQGVRFLTEYAQYIAPVNNHDLFYEFQGLTDDGAYYVIVILPVTAPLLQESADLNAVAPPGGVAFPDVNNQNADWEGYYNAVTDLLNGTASGEFSPTLDQLDALIESIQITP